MNKINQTSKNRSNHNIQTYRKIVQYLFLAVTLLIGVQFGIFVSQLEKGILPTMTRPPGIDHRHFAEARILQLGVSVWPADGVFKSAPSVYFQKGHQGSALAGLPAAQFEVSAAFLFSVGHHHTDERPRPGSFYLQSLQYGGGHQDAALFYEYLRVRFLGIGGFIGLIHIRSQLLVPISVPLWCASGRTQLYQYF
jgi:hypothetical protein